MRYALHFVPHKLEREKFALLRRKLCKRFENRKAVMYPIHMTLVKSAQFHDYKEFMPALEAFCAGKKPLKMKVQKYLGNGRSWGGAIVEESSALLTFQQELCAVVEQHGDMEPSEFQPHISLVYSKRLPGLGKKTSPVKRMLLDRVSLVMQTTPGTPFRVVKHILLGG